MCVIAVDPTLGCGPPEVRPLLGDVFFLCLTIVRVIFTSHPSYDTTAISAEPAVLFHPIQFILQWTNVLMSAFGKVTWKCHSHIWKWFSVCCRAELWDCPSASLSFTFSPHLFGITLITLLTICAELLHSSNASVNAMLTFLMIMRLQISSFLHILLLSLDLV